MRPRVKTTRLYIAGSGLLLLAVLVFVQAAFNLAPFINPDQPGQTILLYALSTFIFLVLIVFGAILLRNLIKVWVERRAEAPGARFKTQLILSMILLTLVPATFLFLFAFGLVTRSIDKWFSMPVDQIFLTTEEIGRQWNLEYERTTRTLLDHLQRRPRDELPQLRQSFRLNGILILDPEGRVLEQWLEPDADISSVREPVARAVLASPQREVFGNVGGFWVGARHIAPMGGIVAIVMPSTKQIQTLTSKIAEERAKYNQLAQNRKFYRDTYVYILLLLTVLVLFAAVWIGLFLSKRITVPIEALAVATREISAGNLSHRVTVPAEDELRMLIGLFNDMAGQLQVTTHELEERRRSMEIILESIPTGVISIDNDFRVRTINRGARTMFSAQQTSSLPEVFHSEDLDQIRDLLAVAETEGTVTREVTFATPGRPAQTAVTVSRLMTGGFVLVVEDLTEIVKAQKAGAWREVARQLAHEIRNPLTPIQLSAERIAKNLSKLPAVTPRLNSIIDECIGTIMQEVSGLKNLVDEFVRFARLPAVNRRPTDVRALVERTLALYGDRVNGTVVSYDVRADVPQIPMDPLQMKRVFINLIDNAIEAMSAEPEKELRISCELVRDGTMARLTVADTGRGIRPEDRERLFTPYFSTRKNGTGLGLSIASRIVADHGGYIGVEPNRPRGTRFIIELPVCQES